MPGGRAGRFGMPLQSDFSFHNDYMSYLGPCHICDDQVRHSMLQVPAISEFAAVPVFERPRLSPVPF